MIVPCAFAVASTLSAPRSRADITAYAAASPPKQSDFSATVTHNVRRGETVARVLQRYGVTAGQARRWEQAARRAGQPVRLIAGPTLTMTFHQKQLETLRYHVDDQRQAVIEHGDPQPSVYSEEIPAEVTSVGVELAVAEGFRASAKDAGVPDEIISAVADILAWEIDFATELQRGDRMRVLYEQRKSREGRMLRAGRVLAVELVGRARTLSAFLYEDGLGESTYLDAQGRRLQSSLLRYPVELTRISSSFSYARFHPILRRSRPHRGVDFSAPTGTPVRAIGAGVVRWAGWRGDLGRQVEIEHGDGVVSTYSHLSTIAAGVHPGAEVSQGQVIGAVGSTGLATGPHLHFAIFENGRYVNPLELRPPRSRLRVDRRRFEAVRRRLAEQLQSIAGAERPTPSVPSSRLSPVGHLGPILPAL